ncbi:phage tail protein [Salmonella enterica subsp. salamae]|nr:phage tail protein [Salmonella enterica subsp. salamae]ECJ2281375.1 phage tail protein [Salmonella enterica subsp. salamae]
MKYTTKDGERLDTICAKHYGFTNNSFEQVLYDTKNYDLTTSEIFPANVTIELPIIQADKRNDTYSLWD